LRALALFSGGLDSSMAVKVVSMQGIEVIALNFVSYFFGGKNPKAEAAARELNIKLEYIDFKEDHKDMLEDPPSGYGKNMNPCIDCHAMMIKYAKALLEKYNAKFIITGEVLGQRPMSQNKNALRRVEKLSGALGYVVRPLSAKLLEETIPEKQGWINRENLLDIQGRSRKRQLELAKDMGVTEFPSPGGGCLLTEPNYSNRLKVLKEDEQFQNSYLFEIIKHGRFYRFDKGKYLLVGRDEEANEGIQAYKKYGTVFIKGSNVPGPVMLGVGTFDEEEKNILKQLFARYSKNKGKVETEMYMNDEIVKSDIIDEELIKQVVDKYQIK